MAGIQNHLVGGAQANPLHLDFNPVNRGTFQGRDVTLAAPEAPIRRHAPPMTFGEKLQSFASKVRKFFGGETSQDSYRFRWGLRQVAREATALANEILSKHGQLNISKASLQGHVDQVMNSVTTCTSLGANRTDVIKARFEVMLKGMDATQIVALENTLNEIKKDRSYQNPQLSEALEALQGAITNHRAQILENLHPYVGAELDQLLTNPTNDNLNAMIHKCRAYGHNIGLGSDMDTAYGLYAAAIGNRLVNINQHIYFSQHSPESLQEMEQFKAAAPTLISDSRLQFLHGYEHPLLKGDDVANGHFFVNARIGARIQTLHGMLENGVEKLGQMAKGEVPASGVTFLDSLKMVLSDLAKTRAFERVCEGLDAFDIQSRFDKITELAMEHPEGFSKTLFDLTPKELIALKDIATKQGLSQINDLIDAHFVDRRGSLSNKFGSSFEKILNAIRDNSPLDLLRSTHDHVVNADLIIEDLQTLGEKIDDPESIFEYRAGMVSDYFSKLSTEDKIELLRTFSQPENIKFLENLIDLSYDKVVQGLPSPFTHLGLQAEIFGDVTNLLRIKGQILESLPQDLENLPASYEYPDPKFSDLSEEQMNAIQEHYGVLISEDQPIVSVKGAAERALEMSFRSQLPKTDRIFKQIYVSDEGQAISLTPSSPESNPALEVGSTFWVDLPRADYRLKDSEGNITNILDRDSLPGGDNPEVNGPILAEAALKLQEFIGDSDFTQLVTQYVHQGLLSPVQGVLASGISPIGNAVVGHGYMNGEQSTSYTIEKNQDGSLTVNVEHTVTRASHFIAMGENQGPIPIPLNPDESYMKFNYAVNITPDRLITVSSSPVFESHIAQ